MTRRPTFRAALIQTAGRKVSDDRDLRAADAVDRSLNIAAFKAGKSTAQVDRWFDNTTHVAWRRILIAIETEANHQDAVKASNARIAAKMGA